MSFLVNHRITGQPTNTGSQQVSTRYSRTDGTPMAAGTPKAARPPISAASTAPTPPGVGRGRGQRSADHRHHGDGDERRAAAEGFDAGPKRQRRAESRSRATEYDQRQSPRLSGQRRPGRSVTSFNLGRTVGRQPAAATWARTRRCRRCPAPRPRSGTAPWRSGRSATGRIDAPATALKKISSARCTITCTACCSATAAVARIADRPLFCRYRVLSASPPTPAGVVVAAKVLATWTIDSCQNSPSRRCRPTTPRRPPHTSGPTPPGRAAPTTSSRSSARKKNVGAVLMKGYAT